MVGPSESARLMKIAEEQLNRPAGRNRKVTKLKTVLFRASPDGRRFDRLFVKLDGTEEVTAGGTTTTKPLVPAGKTAAVTLGVNDLKDDVDRMNEWAAAIRFQIEDQLGRVDRGGISRAPVTAPDDPLVEVKD